MSAGTRGLQHFIVLLARIFVAAYFIVNGLHNAVSFHTVMESMSSVTHIEGLLMVVTILQFLGGVLVIIGWYTRLGGFVLFVALLIMTWLELLVTPSHLGTSSAVMATFMQFIDNIGFAGGVFYVMAFGAGAVSIDRLRIKNK